jgi:hypothetical protein
MGIQAIGGQTERQPGIPLFELCRPAGERLAFAILLTYSLVGWVIDSVVNEIANPEGVVSLASNTG